MTLKVLLIIAIVFLLFFKTKRNLHMLQQNLYNENKRYIKWLVKNREQFMDIELIIIGVLLIESLVLYDIKYFTIIDFPGFGDSDETLEPRTEKDYKIKVQK